MPNSVRVTIRNNRIPQVLAVLRERSKAAVDDTAEDVRTLAYQLAPVDTGALRNSIYINNGDVSDYAQQVGLALNLNPLMEPLEEIDPEFVISLAGNSASAYLSVVGVAAHYGVFQEQGTVFQPPQPFLLPSVEGNADNFSQRMGHIADGV